MHNFFAFDLFIRNKGFMHYPYDSKKGRRPVQNENKTFLHSPMTIPAIYEVVEKVDATNYSAK